MRYEIVMKSGVVVPAELPDDSHRNPVQEFSDPMRAEGGPLRIGTAVVRPQDVAAIYQVGA
jgi:hypothetical protein